MADVDDRYIAKAKKLVFERFPEMDGIKPSVSTKMSQSKEMLAGQPSSTSPPGPSAGSGRSSGCPARYVLTFERDVSLPGGGKMKRLVRLTMDEAGEVLRLSSSK
jgi:hypothetical protein